MHNSEPTHIEIVEQKLHELHEQIKKMEKENAELFAELGIGPHQLEEMLSDPTLYSREAFDFIQKQRKALQDILDRRIMTSRARLKLEKPREAIRSHWILMR